MPQSDPLAAVVAASREVARREGRRRALAAVVQGVARAHDVPAPPGWPVDVAVEVPSTASPDLLGAVHQHLMDAGERRSRGAHYTPPTLADQVAELAFGAGDGASGPVADPSVGGGALLLAAARRMRLGGRVSPSEVVGRLRGVDTDLLAVEVTRAALWLWSAIEGEATAAEGVEHGDGLTALETGAHAVVLANPPFLGQLSRHTARSAAEQQVASQVLGSPAGYADASAVFLRRAVDLLADGGVAAVIVPEAVLASVHGTAARQGCLAVASLHTLWSVAHDHFGSGVRVAVPVLVRRTASDRPVTVLRGPALGPAATDVTEVEAAGSPSWAPLLSAAAGAPEIEPVSRGELGDVCEVSADFRDEYYRLVPHVGEADETEGDVAPLVTSGAIDPASLLWGVRPVRFARRRWEAPVVRLEPLAREPGAAEWLAARRRPKVLLATQTPVLEAVVDAAGAVVPVTPVISLVPEPRLLLHVAAVLLSPVATCWARTRARGAALSADAIKLSAGQVREIPLPAHWVPWDDAATLVGRAHHAEPEARPRLLAEAASLMLEAYDVDPDHPAAADWSATILRLARR